MEYSLQVEHREPWTQLILPRQVIDSVESLFLNQGRIVTGHDLYQTLRGLMGSRKEKEYLNDDDGKNITPWGYNILRDTIPASRTCNDAKVPLEFCPCEEQVDYRPPPYF